MATENEGTQIHFSSDVFAATHLKRPINNGATEMVM